MNVCRAWVFPALVACAVATPVAAEGDWELRVEPALGYDSDLYAVYDDPFLPTDVDARFLTLGLSGELRWLRTARGSGQGGGDRSGDEVRSYRDFTLGIGKGGNPSLDGVLQADLLFGCPAHCQVTRQLRNKERTASRLLGNARRAVLDLIG